MSFDFKRRVQRVSLFVGCCVCVCLWVFFLFLLVGVATSFTTTIDDDGSLWCLLEPHGCFDFLLLPSIRGGGWGLC